LLPGDARGNATTGRTSDGIIAPGLGALDAANLQRLDLLTLSDWLIMSYAVDLTHQHLLD
jgi:hypothetical protein